MNLHKKILAAFIVLGIISGAFLKFTVKAEDICPEEPRMFEACVEWSPQGWIVKGTLEDFPPDVCQIQPMCSTDGVTYLNCGQEWDLTWLNSEEEGAVEKMKSQRCLYDSEEPFKSYLGKDLDRFYMKLRIVREGGAVCETKEAVIQRGELCPVPAECDLTACFAPELFVREGRPPKIKYYGRYQMTVREDASGEEISSCLPDTLPVEIQIHNGSDYIGNDIVDCPVQWKILNLPELTPGESVAVLDAAEEIVVNAGTVLHTQRGIYQLSEPVGINQWGLTDEVNLMLNVVPKDGEPQGALSENRDGLEAVFHLKPTGARSIRAYTISEGDTEWKEISGLSLMDGVNVQPSTASSGYVVILGMEQEPYLSYRKAKEAGEEPEPFFVGLKIEGGVFDGRELILSWPDTYELPLALPKMGGAGGNENNAGANDKGDSTQGGQRPVLPEETKDEKTAEPEDNQPKGPVQDENPVTKTETPEKETSEKETSEKETAEKAITEREMSPKEILGQEVKKRELVKNNISSQNSTGNSKQQETPAPRQKEETVSDRAEKKTGSETKETEQSEQSESSVSDLAEEETVTALALEEEGRVQPDIQKKSVRERKNTGKNLSIPAVLGVLSFVIWAGYYRKKRGCFRKHKQ